MIPNAEIKVGIFVTVTLILATAVFLWLSGAEVFDEGYVIEAIFTQVGGLRPGAPIQLAGVDIGRVKEVSFTSNGQVAVRMLIKPGVVLTEGSTATISNAGFLGEKQIQIIPGSGRRPLTKGSVLEGKEPFSMEEFLHITFKFIGTLDKIADSIEMFMHDEELQRSVKTTLSQLEKSSGNLEKFSRQLAGMNLIGLSKELESTLSDLRQIINEGGAGMKSIVTHLDRALGNLSILEQQIAVFIDELHDEGKTSRRLISMIASLESTAKHLNEISAYLAAEGPNFGPLVDETRQAVRSIDSAAKELDKILQSALTEEGSLQNTVKKAKRILELGDQFLETYDRLSLSNQLDLRLAPEDWGLDYQLKLNWNPQDSLIFGVQGFGNKNLLSLQYGIETPPWQLRMGIRHNWLGFGVDYYYPHTSLHVDLWQPNDPVLDITARYLINPYHLTVGFHDLLENSPGWSFGVGRRF